MAKVSPRPMVPLPEMIRPGAWTIKQGQPRTNLKTREMWLQLQDDPSWRAVRAHELAHAAFTPRSCRIPKTIRELTWQAVEDMRINRLASVAGVNFSAGCPANIVQGLAHTLKDNLEGITLALVASFDQKDLDRMVAAFAAAGSNSEIIERAKALRNECYRMFHTRRRMGRYKPWEYPRTLKVAKWLDDQFKREANNQAIGDLGEHTQAGKDAGAGWMVVETPALTSTTAHRHVRTSDEGSILRAPWRVTTDHRVFRCSKVPRTGSVLIDASGSMSLTPEMVAEIAAALPAGIVAAYSGGRDGGPLRILGKRGKVASPKLLVNSWGRGGRAGKVSPYEFPGGNVIDVPALEWLATQPAPRVWICDGVVTGIGDVTSEKVTDACNAIVKRAGITRVPNQAAAMRLLRKGR